jgi:hypothetical protein
MGDNQGIGCQTVVITSDTTRPTVVSTWPLADANGLSPSTTLTATFSEPVTGVAASNVQIYDHAGTRTDATVTYDPATRTATIDPTADLAPDREYVVQVGFDGGIVDRGGNSAVYSWQFVTGPGPMLASRTPLVGGMAIGVTANVTATFDEPVQGVTTSTFVLQDAAGSLVPAAVTYNAATRIAMLNPTASLAPDSRYSVNLWGGGTLIRDLVGNPFSTQGWTFTTGPAPRVSARTPAVGATRVSRTANVTATFSEPVVGLSGTTVVLRSPTGALIPAAVTYNPTTRMVILNPTATLAARTKYTATLTGGVAGIRDAAGNSLAATIWSFTTSS